MERTAKSIWDWKSEKQLPDHRMFSNRFYGPHTALNWANLMTAKGQRRFSLLQKLFRMRKEYPALGNRELLWCRHTAADQILVFIRPDKKEPWFVAVNLTDIPVTAEIADIPRSLYLLKPELCENVRWFFCERKMRIQMLGFAYLAAVFPAE